MSLLRLPIRAIIVILVGVMMLTGCAREVSGLAISGDRRPQDVWQLADDLVSRSPATPATVGKILGIDLKPMGNGGFRGGPVELGPKLVVQSVRVLDVPAVTAVLLALKTPDCIRLADVQSHYPAIAKRVAIVQGGIVVEQWAASYPWGALSFAVQQPAGCVQSMDVSYPKIRR